MRIDRAAKGRRAEREVAQQAEQPQPPGHADGAVLAEAEAAQRRRVVVSGGDGDAPRQLLVEVQGGVRVGARVRVRLT